VIDQAHQAGLKSAGTMGDAIRVVSLRSAMRRCTSLDRLRRGASGCVALAMVVGDVSGWLSIWNAEGVTCSTRAAGRWVTSLSLHSYWPAHRASSPREWICVVQSRSVAIHFQFETQQLGCCFRRSDFPPDVIPDNFIKALEVPYIQF
jgi:hypothetical protein